MKLVTNRRHGSGTHQKGVRWGGYALLYLLTIWNTAEDELAAQLRPLQTGRELWKDAFSILCRLLLANPVRDTTCKVERRATEDVKDRKFSD